jgi:hypothetical protein
MSGPGKRGRKKKDNKRKVVDNTSVENAKVPRIEDGENDTLGATGATTRSTRISKSGEGKSGIILLLISLYCHSLLTLLF